MPRLIWSRNALRDIERLRNFLISKNKDAAIRAVKAIRQGVRLLSVHPEGGRPAEDMPAEFREWIIEFGSSAYIVLYRYEADVIILSIRHAKENGYLE